jgi:UDP-N-acetylmuramoylalanine--D-glutamate ligase
VTTDSPTRVVSDPRKANCFRFLDCTYDPATGVASLAYAFDDGPALIERITFPYAPWPPEASRQAAFQRALEILHLVAGVSYYKAGLSGRIEIHHLNAINGLSEFLNELYIQGLGELGHINRVDISNRVDFPVGQEARQEGRAGARPLILPERALVAMGGGKDSLVGLDLMQKAGIDVMPVCVGGSSLIGDTVKTAGLPMIRIGRQLAPELAEMNRVGAWNGHIPVTAINSAILLCASILYGFRYIVFSNERSADEATLITASGQAINHQFSKSSVFEASFRRVIAAEVSPDIEYFSILRQHSELGIVRRFAKLEDFHPVYSSCNRNFHLDGPRVKTRWCLNCPKCRFAALSLALFLSPEEVKAIQGGDLLDDPAQADGFRALCRLGREKPFECVGEAGESRAALAALGKRPEWARKAVVRECLPELDPAEVPSLDDLFRLAGRHFIPQSILANMNGADPATSRVAILGMGREGQAAWRYLRRHDPDSQIALVAETAPEPDFQAQLTDKDRVVLGPLSEAGLEGFDILVRSPGISLYRNSLQQAKAAGAQITSPSNLWFAAHPRQKTICISGTKGKSTTSALVAHMLSACGLHVRLAGNIGVPLLDCADRGVDWWVVELSSYQLADLQAQPTVSLLLNLSPEHLDWHGGELNYRHDKLRLAELAGNHPLIANAADKALTEALSGRPDMTWFNQREGIRVEDGRVFDGEAEIPVELPPGLPGAHNLANVAAALTVLRVMGADLSAGLQSLASFRSLPHRLQTVGERKGVRYINDSISSTPVATVAALEAFAAPSVTLLVGGLDRGLDWAPYIARIKRLTPNAVIGVPDSGSRIIREMKEAGIRPENGLHEATDLEMAIKLARNLTPEGGLVLLSPGAPSFPRYNDYRDRGRQFTELSGFEFSED